MQHVTRNHLVVAAVSAMLVAVPALGFAGGQKAEAEDAGPQTYDVREWAFSEETEVTVLTGWTGGSEAEAEAEFMRRLEEQYANLNIELERMPSDRIRQVSNSRIAAGNPPDIAHTSPGYNIADRAQQGALYDLSPFWEEYGWEEVVPQGLQSVLQIDGNYYAVPINMAQHNFLWWNKRVFEGTGVPEPPYDSWDAFFQAGDQWQENQDIPFFVNGLLPPTEVGFGNTTALAAFRYGVDIYRRFTNGEATEQDWRRALQFHEKLMGYGNEDYVSTRGMFENQRRVAAGDGALTYQGNWGRTAFVEAGMELGVDYGRTQFPSPEPIFEYNPSSYIVFSNSGNERASSLIAVSNLFPEHQRLINQGKGTPPARTDMELDPEVFPDIVTYGAQYAGEAALIGKYNVVFPPQVISDMSPIVVSYLSGETGLDETVDQLMSIQEQYSDSYVFEF